MAEQHRWGTAFVTFVVLGLVTVAGCGGNADLGTVAGVVTLDGQPLANATVEFIPTDDGETRSSYDGTTDASGRYELYFSAGKAGAARAPIASTFGLLSRTTSRPRSRRQSSRPGTTRERN